jgi:hypothetical protein
MTTSRTQHLIDTWDDLTRSVSSPPPHTTTSPRVRAPLGAALFGAIILAVVLVQGRQGVATPGSTAASATPTPAPSDLAGSSGQEWLDSVFECLSEAGWNVSPTFDGGWTVEVPPERQAAFRTARLACEAKVGPMPPAVPATQEEIIHRYAYLLEMRTCLIRLGFTISEPPPLKEFVDTWATGPWSPYLDLPSGPTPATERSCPQVEPT